MNSTIHKPDHCPVCGLGVDDDLSEPAESPCPRCEHLLWYVCRCEGDVTVIHMTDHRAVLMELLELLDNAVGEGEGDCRLLLINFGSLQHVSSAALGKLVKLMSKAEAVRGKLKLCGLHADLRQVLKITRLDRIFDIYDSEVEALASFAPSYV